MTPDQKQQQIAFIERTERVLGFNATQMHKALFVHQKTYSKWRTGETEMTAIAITALKMLVTMKVCNNTKKDSFTEWMGLNRD